MRDLIFIQSAPCDLYFLWQTQMWLESLREIDKSDKAVSLIFIPQKRELDKKWLELEKLYPESKFEFIYDTDGISKLLYLYIPLLRPYCLMKYFKKHPELETQAILYCDCDVLFTSNFNVDNYIQDDICYLSDTIHYVGAKYWDSKLQVHTSDHPEGKHKKGDPIHARQDRFEEFKQRDILQETAQLVGISREIAEKNESSSGGAQYLLKGITWQFWDKVLTDCIKIKIHLNEVNAYFFENESKAWQSWTSDMWAVLWNLWYFKKETKIIPEMDFAWSTDPLEKVARVGIFHNAGISSELTNGKPTFFKGKYHKGLDPFTDPHLEVVHNNEESKTLGNWYYVDRLIQIKHKFNL